MADSVLTYLLCLQNFGRYTNEARAIELISTYRHQIANDSRFMKLDGRIGDMIRELIDNPA